MLKRYIFSVFLFFCFLAVNAQRYLSPIFQDVDLVQNITYGVNATVLYASIYGQAVPQQLKCDIYRPQSDNLSNRPVVIYLHSGTFLPLTSPIQPNTNFNGSCGGTKQDSAAVETCTRLAKMGYVAVSMNYRLGWNPVAANQVERKLGFVNATYRGVQDLHTCIRFLRKSIAEQGNPYGIDPDKIIVWGDGTGAVVGLTAATTDAAEDFGVVPSPMGGVPVINEVVMGNINGTSTGILNQAISGLPAGDTLCYPNHIGYPSDFHLAVNNSGFLTNSDWIQAGQIPFISFASTNDPEIACSDGAIVDPSNSILINTTGSCKIQELAFQNNINQLFIDAEINDCISAQALSINGGKDGFYPFIGLTNNHYPWEWTNGSSTYAAGCPTDGAYAKLYLDTMVSYFAPRACAALGHCDPNGGSSLCDSRINGRVFRDVNANGIQDMGEAGMPEIVVTLQPSGTHGISNAAGNYSFIVQEGTYQLNVGSPPLYYSAPAVISQSISSSETLNNVNIGLIPQPNVQDLELSMISAYPPKPGFGYAVTLVVRNKGTIISAPTQLKLDFDPLCSFVDAIPNAMVSGNTLTWDINAMQEGEITVLTVHFLVSTNANLGDNLNASAEITNTPNDATPSNNSASLSETIVGAFDPNDKTVSVGNLTPQQVADGQWLTYKIRFQNTGTAPASKVMITDSLSNLLDINTLQMISASHPYILDIKGTNKLVWTFEPINLPDMTSNEPRSHGFVQFRVRPNSNLTIGQSIHNNADIFFDFNTPIRTNDAVTNIGLVGTHQLGKSIFQLEIMPNPVTDVVNLRPSNTILEEAYLQITNASGQLVFDKKVNNLAPDAPFSINLKDYPAGMYFVKLFNEKMVFSGLVMKK